MNIKKIMVSLSLCIAILASSLSMAPLREVKAETKVQQIETIKAYINQAKDTKKFGIYNVAYKLIMELPSEEQGTYLKELSSISQEVYTPLNLEIINKLQAFTKDANIGDYEALIVEIKSKVKDPIDNGYFLGELTSWGKKLVYTPEVIASVNSIVDVYSLKTLESVNIAKANITKVDVPKSRKWLYEQLIQIASQLGDFIIISFE